MTRSRRADESSLNRSPTKHDGAALDKIEDAMPLEEGSDTRITQSAAVAQRTLQTTRRGPMPTAKIAMQRKTSFTDPSHCLAFSPVLCVRAFPFCLFFCARGMTYCADR